MGKDTYTENSTYAYNTSYSSEIYVLSTIVTASLPRKYKDHPSARDSEPHEPPQLQGLMIIYASCLHGFVSIFLDNLSLFALKLTKTLETQYVITEGVNQYIDLTAYSLETQNHTPVLLKLWLYFVCFTC